MTLTETATVAQAGAAAADEAIAALTELRGYLLNGQTLSAIVTGRR